MSFNYINKNMNLYKYSQSNYYLAKTENQNDDVPVHGENLYSLLAKKYELLRYYNKPTIFLI